MTASWEAGDYHPGSGGSHHPFHVADRLGSAASMLAASVPEHAAETAVRQAYSAAGLETPRKALANARLIAAGFAVAAQFNASSREEGRMAA